MPLMTLARERAGRFGRMHTFKTPLTRERRRALAVAIHQDLTSAHAQLARRLALAHRVYKAQGCTLDPQMLTSRQATVMVICERKRLAFACNRTATSVVSYRWSLPEGDELSESAWAIWYETGLRIVPRCGLRRAAFTVYC